MDRMQEEETEEERRGGGKKRWREGKERGDRMGKGKTGSLVPCGS
jgi:hypothetical protein